MSFIIFEVWLVVDFKLGEILTFVYKLPSLVWKMFREMIHNNKWILINQHRFLIFFYRCSIPCISSRSDINICFFPMTLLNKEFKKRHHILLLKRVRSSDVISCTLWCRTIFYVFTVCNSLEWKFICISNNN